MPTSAELSQIYDLGYFRDDPDQPDRDGYPDYVAGAASHRRNARRRLRMLATHHPVRGRLLDVGCAAGYFVAEASAAGWEAEGTDISPDMIEWGLQHVTPNLSLTPFADLRRPSGGVSAVTMWDYIEHSVDPRMDLAMAHDLLSQGGIVALSTGDVNSRFARWTGKRWHLLTPRHHNYFFGSRSLVRLLEDVGFDVIAISHEAAWYPVGHLLYKLGSLTPFDAARRVSTAARRHRLGDIEVPINLWDIVTVVAQKSDTLAAGRGPKDATAALAEQDV